VARDIVKCHIVAAQRADMRDAAAHLAGADHAHVSNLHSSTLIAPRNGGAEPSAPQRDRQASFATAIYPRCSAQSSLFTPLSVAPLGELFLEFRHGLEQVGDQAVVGDLED